MESEKRQVNLKTRVFTLGEDQRKVEVSTEDLESIFKGFRPRLMHFEDFKEVRKILKKELAQYLNGELVHLSKVSDAVWMQYTEGKKIKQRGQTYVKKKDNPSGDEHTE